MRVAVLTVSDSVSRGERQDRSGPGVAERCRALGSYRTRWLSLDPVKRVPVTVMDRRGKLYSDPGNPALGFDSRNRAREEEIRVAVARVERSAVVGDPLRVGRDRRQHAHRAVDDVEGDQEYNNGSGQQHHAIGERLAKRNHCFFLFNS